MRYSQPSTLLPGQEGLGKTEEWHPGRPGGVPETRLSSEEEVLITWCGC